MSFNLVIAVFDTARRDRFGCYGYTRNTTPAVDAFASESLVFDRMITPAPWTVPSHASLFTGLYPREHGAEFPAPVLRSAHRTLARHLSDQGYTTACLTANALLTRTGLEDGFHIVLAREHFDSGVLRRRARFVLGLHDTGALAVVRMADRMLAESVRSPFFLLVNFMECHWPYLPPRRFERRFVKRSMSWWQSARRRIRERRVQAWEAIALADDGQMEMINDMYDAELATADHRFGLLLESLRRNRLADDTVVVALADHGENIGDYGLATHQGSLHQTLVHIPFIVRIPGGPSGRVSGLVQLTDVFAGLCRVLDVDQPEGLANRPMAVDPFAMRNGAGGRRYAFSEWRHWGAREMAMVQQRSPHYDLRNLPVGLESVQDSRFKLVVRRDTGEEDLYDLETDARETVDVVSSHQEEAARLREALADWHLACPSGEAPVYTAEESGEIEARLRALGYL